MPASSCIRDLYPSLKNMSDDQISLQSAVAESYLTRLLGRSVSGGDFVEHFDGQNKPVIVLQNHPVISVDKVIYNTNGSITEYDANSRHYQWSKKGEVILRNDGFPEHLPGWRPGIANIEIHYTAAGLSQPEQDMLIGGVIYWQSAQAAVNPIVNSETIGEYSYSAGGSSSGGGSSGIPSFIQGLIAPYRRMRCI